VNIETYLRKKLKDTTGHCHFKQAWIPKGWACVEIDTFAKEVGKEVMEMARGNAGRGSRGACGGTRRRDGSGKGVGNRGTKRQPKK